MPRLRGQGAIANFDLFVTVDLLPPDVVRGRGKMRFQNLIG